ncbi:MAG: GTPase Era [Cytophagales bacterium]|nr:MAG: GTPase Era [Cytophagales bacterium]
MEQSIHKAGFVSIVGKPNVGKSTLMNKLVGERLAIITSKAQTTRDRIMGIINGDDFQIVYSDTPGIIEPKYELHKAMMSFVTTALEDADVILFVTDLNEQYTEDDVIKRLQKTSVPIILVINKIDLAKSQQQVQDKIAYWGNIIKTQDTIVISALEGFNIEPIFNAILTLLPIHPAYFEKDEMTDKTERFFAAEFIREKIFKLFDQEIPYCCHVNITDFIEEDKILRIRAQIFVERDSQKGIIIGKGGESLKRIGREARIEMEDFFQKKVFLEQHVKVEPDWRTKDKALKSFGF